MTDKVHRHGYDRFYKSIVSSLLNKPTRLPPAMVEIGVAEGHSIPFWKGMAPSWMYIGLDKIENSTTTTESLVELHVVDQSDPVQLQNLVDFTSPRYSVLLIVDDGSHIPNHQIVSFNKLFPLLEDGGVYVIEDVETSYWTHGDLYSYPISYGFRHPESLVERFKQVLDIVNVQFLHTENRTHFNDICKNCGFDPEALRQVRTITFGPNFVSISKKIHEEDDVFDRKPYLLS
jgi:hypothetical protein